MADLYGSDLSTFAGENGAPDIDPLFRPITGPRVVLEAVARRLLTPNGIPGAPQYGIDIRSLLGKRMTPINIERAKRDIEAEAARDERVLSAKVVEFVETATKGTFRIRISVTLAEGPFSFVLSVSQVSAELLKTDQG